MSKASAAPSHLSSPDLSADGRPPPTDRFAFQPTPTPSRHSLTKPIVRASPNFTSLVSQPGHLSPATPTLRAVTPDPDDEPAAILSGLPSHPGTISGATQLHISPTTPPRTPSKGPMNTFPHSSTQILGSVAKRFDHKSAAAALGGGDMSDSPRLRASRTVPSLSSFSDLNLRASSKAAMERQQQSQPIPIDDASLEYPPSNTSSSSLYVARSRQQAGSSISSASSSSNLSSLALASSSGVDVAPAPKKRFLRTQHSTNTLTKTNPKAASSTASLSMTTAQGTIETFSEQREQEDVGRVMALMQQLKGKMEGFLQFRLAGEGGWAAGHCIIDEESGSLMLAEESGGRGRRTPLIPDLRGCQLRTPNAAEDDGTIEVHILPGKIYRLKPAPGTYDFWLAALLGWAPMRPASSDARISGGGGASGGSTRPPIGRRRNSETIPHKDPGPSIIKVGKMLLWRRNGPTTTSKGNVVTKSGKKHQPTVAWTKTSCTLQDNGEFKLYTEADTVLIMVVQLGQLSRCAVQQLDPSILDQDFCIAIYPQYTPGAVGSSQAKQPVYLAVESRLIFEVWFVLLRAFTLPELFGPAPSSRQGPEEGRNELEDSYRIQRSLFLRVVEAKIIPHDGEKMENLDCYAEVHLDGEVRAKTMVRTKTHNPFWREDYEFPDLPAVLSEVAVVLKQRDPRWKQKTNGSVIGSGGHGGGLGGSSVPGSRDVVIGRVEIRLEELKFENDTEGWWPLVGEGGEKVGEMFLKIGMEELIVLCADEYKALSEVNSPSPSQTNTNPPSSSTTSPTTSPWKSPNSSQPTSPASPPPSSSSSKSPAKPRTGSCPSPNPSSTAPTRTVPPSPPNPPKNPREQHPP